MFDNGFEPGFVFRHPVFLVTYIIAIPAWLIAFAAQCASEAKYTSTAGGRTPVCGALWFSIWIQLAVIIHLFCACATDGLAAHRMQLSIVIAIVVVFSVIGVQFIYDTEGPLIAVGVGWLLTCMVDLVWLLYLTSEEGTLFYRIFTSGGTGGLSGWSGGRRGTVHSSLNAEAGYATEGAGLRGGASRAISSQDMAHGTIGSGYPLGGYSSRPMDTTPQKTVNSITREDVNANSPTEQAYRHRAKANYAYSASPDDPNEVSFAKGDILEVVDTTGKWYQVRTPTGQVGIAPSNYLTLI